MRDKIKEAVKEFDAILKPGDNTEITYLGTPQTAMSLYNVLGERGYNTKIWTARVPDADLKAWYGKRLAKIVTLMTNTGHSTDPTRFSDKDLTEREASYGRSGFALQFMLDTSLSDAEKYPLRTSDLIVMNVNPTLAPEKLVWAAEPQNKIKDLPNLGFDGDAWYSPMSIGEEWRPYDNSIMFIDPSGRGKTVLASTLKHPFNCWKLPQGQSAAKPFYNIKEGSTTISTLKLSGNGGHFISEDMV